MNLNHSGGPPTPASSTPVDLWVAAHRQVDKTLDKDGLSLKCTWYARAETSDGRHVVVTEKYRNMAVAAAIGQITSERPDAKYRLWPHQRIDYRLGQACRCDVCQLLTVEGGLASVEIAAGTMEALGTWEEVSDRCARDVPSTVANIYTVGDISIPCIEYRDHSGAILRRELPSNLPDLIEVGTDASRSIAKSSNTCAAAAVGADGRYAVTDVRTRMAGIPAIDFAELVAIELGVRNWVGKARRVVIRSDSQKALRIAQAAREGQTIGTTGRVLSVARSIVELITAYEELGGEVILEWVKGHGEDPLNNGADSLAVHARRSIEWGSYDSEEMQRRCREIASETADAYRGWRQDVPA